MATFKTGTGGVPQPAIDQAPSSLRLTPETYTTLDSLVKTTKDFHLPELVQSYGDQGITGFLNLTGAVKSGGSSDEINWWEAGRRHKKVAFTTAAADANVLTIGAADHPFQKQDVVMDAATGKRYIVTGITDADTFTCVALDGGATVAPAVTAGTLIHLGNMYAQGTNQPSKFTDPDVEKYTNQFMIVKDRYQVNGSQATNIGWVNLGGGEYRWFMYGEQEARKRFEDRREMMLLFGEKMDGGTSTLPTYSSGEGGALSGSEGYISAIEDRGIVVQGANTSGSASTLDLDFFDDLILKLDQQGAPAEYAMYLNRVQDLAIDDMLALGKSGAADGFLSGLPSQFGAFNNDKDMAVTLGFKSFSRGGYTFHKHDWKLLNDPTLLGASNYLQGAMIPLTNVTDARSGIKVPALAMYYKEANGYSREMDHWVTGGGVMGHNNNGDAGQDVATFHYRSEVALCTRAANQHVILTGPAA